MYAAEVVQSMALPPGTTESLMTLASTFGGFAEMSEMGSGWFGLSDYHSYFNLNFNCFIKMYLVYYSNSICFTDLFLD